MSTRAGAVTNTRGTTGRCEEPGRDRGERAGWRSQRFGDGVYSITLADALDTETADQLGRRLRELCERGIDRVIVDVTGAVEPGTDAPELLAAVLRGHPASCEVVVVIPRRSVLDGLLPARVAVAWSLIDARSLLAGHPVGREPGLAGELGAGDRHALAVRQALRWASQTAGAGDYDDALRGLATIERVEGALPEDWQERRRAWLAARRRQAAAQPRRRARR